MTLATNTGMRKLSAVGVLGAALLAALTLSAGLSYAGSITRGNDTLDSGASSKSLHAPVSSPCFSWSVMPSPNAGGSNYLTSVSAVSADDIWAAGYSLEGDTARTLVEHWDGKAWTIVPSPNPTEGGNYLDGIAAVGHDNVWVVGDSGPDTHPVPLLLHWDGSSWTPARMPQLDPSGNGLYAISASSPTDIWAVGAVGNRKTSVNSLILHYNGVDWSPFASDNEGHPEVLYSVSARAADDAWAVGAHGTTAGVMTRVKHWDGHKWNVVSKEEHRNPPSYLNSVSAVAPNSVWAVGYRCGDWNCENNPSIVERWDGNWWTHVAEPAAGPQDNKLFGVAALSATDIWAVGYTVTGKVRSPLIVHSDGNPANGWPPVPGAPNTPASSTLYAIAVVPNGGGLVVVGVSPGAGGARTLVERYADACMAPTPAPTSTPVPATPTPSPVATYPPTPVPGGNSQTFPETNHSVSGLFLDYWQSHGGLAQQGYPISDMFTEVSSLNGKPYTVQYFERAVFEYHPENQPPYNVLLSQLGTFRYKQKYGAAGAPNQQPNTSEGAVLFSETGHRVGGKFLDYWQSHGGLAQQGYPISEEFVEKSDLNGQQYLVQYFERAVFEYHPENQPPYDVLLSQLGTVQYRDKYPGAGK